MHGVVAACHLLVVAAAVSSSLGPGFKREFSVEIGDGEAMGALAFAYLLYCLPAMRKAELLPQR